MTKPPRVRLSGDDLARAEVHDERADDAQEHGGGEAHQRLRGERADDVVEQALDAAGEDARFALLGVVALDDADAAERFGEAAGDFGVDFAALAEDGADGLEGALQNEARRSAG